MTTELTKAAQQACHCQTCRPITMEDMRMVLCPTCGNKRCPHANDHRNACTGSNEPGQPGSAYPASALTQRPAAQSEAQALAHNMMLWREDAVHNGNEYVPVHVHTLDKLIEQLASLPAPQQATPEPDDEGPEFTVADPDLNNLLNLAADMAKGRCNHDTGVAWLQALEAVAARLKGTPEPVPRSVFIAGNDTAMCAFATRDLAERYVSNFGGATAGGMTVVELPVVGATPEPDTCRKRPRCGRADPCAWLEKQSTQQAAGEPFGWLFQHEETGRVQVVDSQQIEWGFEANNPRWQKIRPVYTRPAPGVPEGWRVFRTHDGIDVHTPDGSACYVEAKATADRRIPEEVLHALCSSLLAAAQAKGGQA